MVSRAEAQEFNQLYTVVDMHAHPVLKTYLFDYNLYEKNENHFPFIEFNPFYLLDPSEMPNLTRALLYHIKDPAQVKLILGGNALRVLKEGWI